MNEPESHSKRTKARALFPVLYAALAILVVRRITPVDDWFGAVPIVGGSLPFFLLTIGALIWRLRCGDTLADFGLRQPKRVVPVVALGVAGGMLSLVVPFMLMPLLTALGLRAPDVSGLQVLEGATVLLVVLTPAMWVMNALGEELLHRGFIMTRLAWLWGDTSAAWLTALAVSSVFFGIGHAGQGPAGIVMTGIAALIYGGVYLLSGRVLWAAVIAHGIKNTAAFVVEYLG